jgi:predicted small metal-binding protein
LLPCSLFLLKTRGLAPLEAQFVVLTIGLQHQFMEVIMARKFIDCREFPSETKCTVTIAADSEEELLDVAAQHATAVHGHLDTPQLRQQLREVIHEGRPPE